MKILIVDKVHAYLVKKLEEEGHEVHHIPNITYEETLSCIDQYNGVVVRSKFKITKELMEKAPDLKFVARAGVGLDIFELDYANKQGIEIINAAGANANAVAEHALGMLISLFSNITKSNSEVKNMVWSREENRATEISGKTIGLIGYGNTGQAFARKLKNFDCTILSYDKYRQKFSDENVNESSLEKIFEHADIISLHIPLNEETRFWCNKDFFKSFKKPITFINTARGKIVNTKELVNALENGQVSGACIDVLENEDFNNISEELKLTYRKLFACNVVVTPHVAGWSHESFENISKVLARNILSITN